MMNQLGHSNAEANSVFRTLDMDGDGNVAESEFVAGRALSKVAEDNDGAEKAEAAFTNLDADGDGTLDYSEVEKVLGALDNATIQAAIAKADGNSDGRIDAKEWANLVEGVLKT